MKYKEVEFKYKADNIKLTDFINFCKKRVEDKRIDASGYDHFYQNKKDPAGFCRLRIGNDMTQLTFKRKTIDSNNFVRDEDNIDYMPHVHRSQIESFISRFNYEYVDSIYKNCFVFKYDYYTLVYYICYNTDLKELGRFVEIEMKEDYPWSNEQEAWDELLTLERLCKGLGITSQGRIKRSLFEMFAEKERA